jgi:hypothetical protein
MIRRILLISTCGFGIWTLVALIGCEKTVYNAHHTPMETLEEEGSIVFVRPDRYTILGTRSIRDYIEITYEILDANDAGFPIVKVGLRNRGGQHAWDKKGPDVQLSIQTAFYNRPIQPGGAASGPATYRTNWQTVKLVRGQTLDYKVTCPIAGAKFYQMTISEYLR